MSISTIEKWRVKRPAFLRAIKECSTNGSSRRMRRELGLEAAITNLDKYQLLILDDIAYVTKD